MTPFFRNLQSAPWYMHFQEIMRFRLIELSGIAMIVIGCTLFFAMVSYHPADPSWSSATGDAPKNFMGLYGAYVADVVLQGVGMAGYMLVPILCVWGFKLLRDYQLSKFANRLTLLAVLLVFVSATVSTMQPHGGWMVETGLGGMIGLGFLSLMAEISPTTPTLLIQYGMGALSVPLFLYVVDITWSEWKYIISEMTQTLSHTLRMLWNWVKYIGALLWAWVRRLFALARGQHWRDAVKSSPIGVAKPRPRKRKTAKAAQAKKRKSTPSKQLKMPLGGGAYVPPSLDLLQDGFGTIKPPTKEELEDNARKLEEVLRHFKVGVRVRNVRPGPVVTLYEVELEPGTPSQKVISRSDDIAMNMSARSVRISTIPERNALGIELPNSNRETVGLRELMSSPAFAKSKMKLPMILGKDIGGEPQVVDMAAMPHLLIAGTTGSGKSVGLNAMILSLLYRLSPSQCRLIMVDPKMLELSVYDDIPHLLTPVVTDPKKAVVALKWAVVEMERRYSAMSKMGVRNIESFNEKVVDARRKGKVIKHTVQTGFDEGGKPIFEEEDMSLEPLPYIVIVVDELADLMLVAGKEIEASIQRLAQMARAAGLHLIMATQRPSVDVLTGTIKSNFPSRISFMVSSAVNSRTILDEMGAEKLLGRGDMLYRPNGGTINRIHGPFVDDNEVNDVCNYLRTLGEPDYVNSVVEEDEQSGGFETDVLSASLGGTDKAGDLYDRAVNIVTKHQKASTSFIQRQLKIGYNRAADLIDRMEDEGIVSPANHVGKRDVLVPKRDYQS